MKLDLRINEDTLLVIIFLIIFFGGSIFVMFNLFPASYFWIFILGLWVGVFLSKEEKK